MSERVRLFANLVSLALQLGNDARYVGPMFVYTSVVPKLQVPGSAPVALSNADL